MVVELLVEDSNWRIWRVSAEAMMMIWETLSGSHHHLHLHSYDRWNDDYPSVV